MLVPPSCHSPAAELRDPDVGADEADATYAIYKDGVLVENATSPWVDEVSATDTACYAVVGRQTCRAALRTQCWWGDDYHRIQTIPADALVANGGIWSTRRPRPLRQRGIEHTLATIEAQNTGEHYIQVTYANGSGVSTRGSRLR